MTRRAKWGRAGERLDPDERERRVREIRGRANRDRASRLTADREAYRRWRAGLVCPNRITLALDLHSLYGPEVDRACKAEEPEVDQWEAGERYPRWDQLVALADLTGRTPRWFTVNTEPPIPIWKTSLWFHMSAAEQRAHERAPAPIMTYPRAVIDEAMLHAAPAAMPTPDAEALQP
jgi:hypothetical protein